MGSMETIDLVIPFVNNPKAWDNNELRYSLRSVEKHLKNIRFTFIVGDCPDWLQNVIHIPFEQTGHKSQNIMEKLLHVCGLEGVSEEFMMWNDDFFLKMDVDATKYRVLFDKHLSDELKYSKNEKYNDYLVDTILALKKGSFATKNFDIHVPIRYNKQKFEYVMRQYNFTENRLLVKSLYCNHCEPFIASDSAQYSAQYSDLKIKHPLTEWELYDKIMARHIFSIGDGALENDTVKNYLQAMFPNKSKYEK